MDYAGHIDEVSRFHVAGWVADRNDWSKSLSVDIFVNGKGQGVCVADRFREKLDALHPNATGRYAFKFYFANPLSMYHEQDITVRVSATSYYLIRKQTPIKAIEGDPEVSIRRPTGPILVSTMGRSGSTAIMAILAQHPNIVVAGERPYEIELGCYYAYALRTLTAAGDQEKSLRSDRITAAENRFQIGFNPYFAPAFATVFRDQSILPRYLASRLPARISGAFREIILDYYEELANDKSIADPIYFAEKSLPERDARLGIRFMFPRVKEIVLIRDLRDVVCSSTRSNGSSFDLILAHTTYAADRLMDILQERRPSTIIVRYEDFILHREQTISRLSLFLGLPIITPDEQRMDELFAAHATSTTPQASIGRWKHDLTAEQQERCGIFDPVLRAFGYSNES
jgi:hypothetical protein